MINISDIKEKFTNSRLVSNFFYLSISQFVSLVIPLLVTPYLVKVLGLELFGLLTFTQTIMLLLTLLVDFGFNISATRSISVNRDSLAKLNTIFTNVIVTKLFLLLVAFLILVFLFSFEKFSNNNLLYLSSFSIVAGQALLPTWFYQGLEKMKAFSFITLISRILYVIFLFLLIHDKEDLILVNILWGGSFLLSSLVSLLHIKYSFSIRVTKPSFHEIVAELKSGSHLFLTILSINIYTYSNSAILGFFVGYKAVGLYAIAEKVMMLLKQALIIFSQVLYPAACKAATNSFISYRKLLKKAYVPFIFLFVLACSIAWVFTPYIVIYFNHVPNSDLEIAIRIFISAVFITALNVPAYQTLLSFNFQKSYSFTLTFCCIFSVIANILLTDKFGFWGTCSNVFLTELIVTVALYTTLHLRHQSYSLVNLRSYV